MKTLREKEGVSEYITMHIYIYIQLPILAKLLKARKERHRIASSMQSDSNGISRNITQPPSADSSLLKDSTCREEFFQLVQHPLATTTHYIPVKVMQKYTMIYLCIKCRTKEYLMVL